MSTHAEFLADIEAFLIKHGMPKTRLGREAMHDTAFVSRIRSGMDLRTRQMDRVYKWMAEYKPEKKSSKAKDRGRSLAVA